MLTGLELENFQGFEGYQCLRLAPITLIFGANASGKSSILRALKLVAQSRDGFKFSGSKVNLSSYGNTIFGQGTLENRLPLTVGLTFSDAWGSSEESSVSYTHTISQELRNDPFEELDWIGSTFQTKISVNGSPTSSFGISMSEAAPWINESENDWAIVESDVESLKQVLYSTYPSTYLDQLLANFNNGSTANGSEEAELGAYLAEMAFWDTVKDQAIKRAEVADNAITISKEVDWSEDSVLLAMVSATFGSASKHLRNFQKNSKFIGAIRTQPDKYEFRQEWTSRGLSGLLDVPNKHLRRLTNDRYSVEISSKKIGEVHSPAYVIQNMVRDHYSGALVGFEDVGAGISQIFPVLEKLRSKAAPSGHGFIAVEQPELHLHPQMQSQLINVLSDHSKTTKEQIILETHSETILNAVQSGIRSGQINPKDVTVVFAEPAPPEERRLGAPRGNRAYNIDFLETGQLENELPLSFAGLRLRGLFG